MMSEALDHANEFLAAYYRVDSDTLLAPVDPVRPAGDALRGTPEWLAIRRARESDDATLPLGAWTHDLKRAAWDQVASATLDALSHRSKDLQLAVWLAEALLHEHGFAGLAAGIAVLDALCECYWDVAYPLPVATGYEHRANLFRWLNEKLVVPARLVPITAAGEAGRAYAWADCERYRRRQTATADAYAANERTSTADSGDDFDAADFTHALRATSDDALLDSHAELGQASCALLNLAATLDECFGEDAPGVGALRGQLEQIRGFVTAELHQRNVAIPSNVDETEDAATGESFAIGYESGGAPAQRSDDQRDWAEDYGAPSVQASGLGRAGVYAQLAAAAAELVRLEPHSPVPYLIQRAIEWGGLNTTQLYDELFIKRQGQLNIFELVGLTLPSAQDA